MSTNAGAIESSSDAVVSSEPLNNSDIAVSNGVMLVVGADTLDSKTETLTTEPSSGGIIVQDLVDNAMVSGDETWIVTDNDEKILDESSSDAVVSSVRPAASCEVKIGADLLESKSGTLIMESSNHDGGGDIVVQDSVDDARVSRDGIGIVIENSELVPDLVDDAKVSGDATGMVMDKNEKLLDESSSDAVVLSEPHTASHGVKIGADLLESKSGTLIMETSDHDGGGDIVAQDVDEIGTVINNSEPVLDKSISDSVVSSVPMSNRDIDAVNGIKIGAGLLDSKTETLTMKPSADQNEGGDITVQDSIDDSRVSGDEKRTAMENIEKVSDENEVNNEEKEGEYNRGGDVAVQDSIDDSRVSGDEKGFVTVNIEKVSDENEVNNEEKEGAYNGGGDLAVQDSVDDSRVSGDEKGIVMENIEKVSDEIEVNNEEKEGEYKVTDLVWAKVKDYPWWPAQIFDPSSSTDEAKKYSNKKAFLVGYFGDQTFAWNKASNIKPFRKNFCKLEKQSNTKAFFHAVNCALDEVSRRVDFGLACSCLSKEVCDKIKSQVFVSAGIRKEASKIDGGDRFSTVSTFKPVKVVQSVQDLAREHFDGFSRLEVLSVTAQLLAFFRWKGYYQLQAQNILDGLDNKLEDESEVPLMEENKVVKDEKPASVGKEVSSKKKKRDVSDSDDSAPRKRERSLTNVTPKGNSSVKKSKKIISKKDTVVDNVFKEEKGNEKPAFVGKKDSSKKRKPDVCDSDDSIPRKKERSLTNVTPKGNSSVKKSKKIRSKKTTVEDDVIKEENGNEKPTSIGKKVSSKKRKPDVSDSDDSVPRKKERSLTNTTSKGNSSVKKSKNNISKKAAVEDNVFKKENGNGTDDKKSSISSPKKLFRIGDSICKIAKQISESPSILKKESQKSKNDENSATALILKFTNLDSVPSVTKLNEIFSRYGRVREKETEILKKSDCAKVVFEEKSNAETAFSNAGKFSIFKSSLISCHLDYSPELKKAAKKDEKSV